MSGNFSLWKTEMELKYIYHTCGAYIKTIFAYPCTNETFIERFGKQDILKSPVMSTRHKGAIDLVHLGKEARKRRFIYRR